MKRICFLVVVLFGCDSTPAAPPGGTVDAEVVEDTRVVEVAPDSSAPDLPDLPDLPELPDLIDNRIEDTAADTADTDLAQEIIEGGAAPETVDVVEDATPEEVAAPLIPCTTDADCDPGLLCVDDACACDPTPVSFTADVVPLFKGTCGASCHVVASATGGSAGLNLGAAFAHVELVGKDASQCSGGANNDRLRVVAGDVGKSYLMDKMLGRRMCRGGRMPKNKPAWSATQKSTLGRWICQGALAN